MGMEMGLKFLEKINLIKKTKIFNKIQMGTQYIILMQPSQRKIRKKELIKKQLRKKKKMMKIIKRNEFNLI